MTSHVVAPEPPSWSVLADWHLDAFVVALVLAGVAYVVAVRRLAQRGRAWPTSRTVSFMTGLAVLAVATQSGLAGYDRVLFSLHVVQHVLLGMAGPLLLALGAPVTLALQAAGRDRQTGLLRVLRTRPVAVLTHPLTAWLLFGGGLVVLYFSALYELSLRYEWVHVLVHVHFVLAGCLFMWHVVGVDPIPHALGYGARLLFVLVALPFHAFLGAALLGSERVLGGDWYDEVVRDWGASPLADQRTGAGILWVTGELLGLVLVLLVVRQWMQADAREASRHDRHLDAARTA